jgi:hypothetical protein
MISVLNSVLIQKFSKSIVKNNTRNLVKLTNNFKITNFGSDFKKILLNNSKSLLSIQKLYYNTDSGSNNSTPAAPSSSNSKDSTVKTSASELIIHHHHEGIVELQLNKHESKNALSKKLIFEVNC